MTSVALSAVVVDTSVVSIIFNQDARRAAFYEAHLYGLQPVISFQTLEELYRWPLRNRWGRARQERLMEHIDQYEIVWPNRDLARISAKLWVDMERAGRPLRPADAWIASTALLLDCPLASHDRDFSAIPNLQVIRAPRP